MLEEKVREATPSLATSNPHPRLPSQILNEVDLGEEVRQLKADIKKAQRNGSSSGSTRKARRSAASTASDTMTTDDEDVCEACGKRGHDIATCEEVFGAVPPVTMTVKKQTNGRPSLTSHEEGQRLWCEDCESHG